MSRKLTHLICTVGTSYLNRLRQAHNPLPSPAHLSVQESNRSENELKKDSAEINSILNILPQVGGEIQCLDFFVSDTKDGKYMGKLYENLMPKILDGKKNLCKVQKVPITIIDDLMPVYERFSPYGLKNLVVKMVQRIRNIRERENGTVAINATGGYKAQISFAGLIGQVMSCDVWYQFEDFATAVKMPPMPVSYSIEGWLDNWDLFDALGDCDLLTPDTLQLTNPREFISTAIGALFEYDTTDNVIYLNPVGQLFHEKFKDIVKREGTLFMPKARTKNWYNGIHDTPNYPKDVMAWLHSTCDALTFITRVNSYSWSGPSNSRLKVKKGTESAKIKVDISTNKTTYPFELITTATSRREQNAAMHSVKEYLSELMKI